MDPYDMILSELEQMCQNDRQILGESICSRLQDMLDLGSLALSTEQGESSSGSVDITEIFKGFDLSAPGIWNEIEIELITSLLTDRLDEQRIRYEEEWNTSLLQGVSVASSSSMAEQIQLMIKQIDSKHQRVQQNVGTIQTLQLQSLAVLNDVSTKADRILFENMLPKQYAAETDRAKYIQAKAMALTLKANVLHSQLLLDTYTNAEERDLDKNIAAALQRAQEEANKEHARVTDELFEAKGRLEKLEHHGDAMKELAKQYVKLQAEIDRKRWSYQYLQESGTTAGNDR